MIYFRKFHDHTPDVLIIFAPNVILQSQEFECSWAQVKIVDTATTWMHMQ